MIECQNHNEKTKRETSRGVRDLVVIHPVDELGVSRELSEMVEGEPIVGHSNVYLIPLYYAARKQRGTFLTST